MTTAERIATNCAVIRDLRREIKIDAELTRQAEQARRIADTLDGRSAIDLRIADLERVNALYRAVRDEQTAPAEVTDRVVTQRAWLNPDVQYRTAYQRELKKAQTKSYFQEQGNRQEYRKWWYEQEAN